MISKKIIKIITIIALVFTVALGLAACGNSEKVPMANIGKDVYATAGDFNVTEADLYDGFRINANLKGSATLNELINRVALADYIAKVDLNNEKHQTYFDELVNKAIYSATDTEKLIKNYKDNDDLKLMAVEKFADTVYNYNPTVNISALVAELNGNTTFSDYKNVDIKDYFIIDLAKWVLATEKLLVDIADKDHSAYVTEAEILSDYKNNIKGHYDVEFFQVVFLNQSELTKALIQLSLKIISNGSWYKVPDIRLGNDDENFVDIDHPGYAHVKSLLSTLKIDAALDENGQRNISAYDFERYVKGYSINTSRTYGSPDVALIPGEILEQMVALYNLFEDEADQLKVIDGVIVDATNNPVDLTSKYDDFTNTSLRSNIYSTLKLPTEDAPNNKQYSQKGYDFDDFTFLFFKISEDSAKDEDVLNEDQKEFLDNEKVTALKAEIKEKLEKAALTATYITEKYNELMKELTIQIYDPILKAYYEFNFTAVGNKKYLNNETIASVGDTHITVADFYNLMESRYGVSYSNNLLLTKILTEKYEKQITSKDRDEFEKQYRDMMNYFVQGGYQWYGFPASIGRDQFLLLALNARNQKEAIYSGYLVPKLYELFNEDYEEHFANVYEKLADFAKLQHDNYLGIKVSHLLVFVDFNHDGTPDNPAELPENVDKVALTESIKNLIALINDMVIQDSISTSKEAKLKKIVDNFNKATRFDSLDSDDTEFYYADYRKLGIKLKYEDLSGTITNTSNAITSETRYDAVFYNRAIAIYDIVKDNHSDLFPYVDLMDHATAVTDEDITSIESSFGWHLIVARAVEKVTSAKLSEANGTSKIEVDGVALNGKNDNDYVNATQIQIYMKELISGYDVEIKAKSALEMQFSPVLDLYNSTNMYNYINFTKLLNSNVSYTKASGMTQFNTLIEINGRQFYQYVKSDEQQNALYEDWFNVFK